MLVLWVRLTHVPLSRQLLDADCAETVAGLYEDNRDNLLQLLQLEGGRHAIFLWSFLEEIFAKKTGQLSDCK